MKENRVVLAAVGIFVALGLVLTLKGYVDSKKVGTTNTILSTAQGATVHVDVTNDTEVKGTDVFKREDKVIKPTVKKVKTLSPNQNRTLMLQGEVGENALYLAQEVNTLSAKSSEPIYMLIDSPGGSVLTGALLISAMQSSRAPIITICQTLCASMAAMIHQFGSQRLQVDRAILMFHPASLGGGGGELDKMASFINMLQRYTNKLEFEVSRRSGIPFKEYKDLSQIELWLDAEDARASNFNDGIVNINMNISDIVILQEQRLKNFKSSYFVQNRKMIERFRWIKQ